MPQLDAMLKALAERGALELRFAEGARPVFRYGDGDRPVSQTALARARILTLLHELAADHDRARLADGSPVRFAYQSPDGRSYICEVDGSDSSVVARVFEGSIEPPTPEREVVEPPSGFGVLLSADEFEPQEPVPLATRGRAPATEVSSSPASRLDSIPLANAAGSVPSEAYDTPGADIADAIDEAFSPSAPTGKGAVPIAAAPEPAPAAAPRSRRATAAMDSLLHRMVEAKASDLHMSPGETPMIRLHGEMMRWDDVGVLAPEETARLLRSILPPRYAQQFDETNDTDFAHEIPDLARFRANLFQDRKGMGGVFRVIPSRIPSADELGVPKAVLDLCHLSKGLVLVTGPTGSGKSTTLAALVDYINSTRLDHIITIEDPIEFVHQNRKCLVNQREVATHTKSFKSALRAALREDPDIVLVGEMRDLETIAIAIETAETGHLVFGTLHTSTAASTVDRIIDQFPADRQAQIRVMLSESLRGVISQTLCKRIGGGRVAALEVLIGNVAIANLIREGKSYQIPSIMQTAKKQGMTLLNDALAELAKKKLITPEEAWLKSLDKNGITSALKALGFEPPSPTAPAH